MDEMDTNYNPYNYLPSNENVVEIFGAGDVRKFYKPMSIEIHSAPIKYDPYRVPLNTYNAIFGWTPGAGIAETRKTMMFAVGAIVVLILLIGGLAVVSNMKK